MLKLGFALLVCGIMLAIIAQANAAPDLSRNVHRALAFDCRMMALYPGQYFERARDNWLTPRERREYVASYRQCGCKPIR